jgi:hypothetical protein
MAVHDFRATFLPYVLLRQAGSAYAVLNREYKPAGFHTRERTKYPDYLVLAAPPLTPAKAELAGMAIVEPTAAI